VHHGIWDYDFPAAPTLVDVTLNGKTIKALAQSSKQAFLYVFDRATGKPLWPIEERPVEQSKVPGEETWPTQPFPTHVLPFDQQGMTEKDVLDFTPELHAKGLEILSHYKSGPIFTPGSLYSKTGTWGTIQMPSASGGANWSGSGADPESGYLYVPSHTIVSVTTLTPLPKDMSQWQTVAPLEGTPLAYVPQGKIGKASIHPDNPPSPAGPNGLSLAKPPYSRMTAYNLNTGDIAWQVPTGNGMYRVRNNPALKGVALPALGGQNGQGGVLVTKTLLIYGLVGSGAPGEAPGWLVAYDKKTGATLGQVALPGVPLGTPMTYQIAGRQYVSLTLVGGRLISLALPSGGGRASNAAPAPAALTAAAPRPVADGLPPGAGHEALQKVCTGCHALDLATSMSLDRAGWDAEVQTMISRGASATPKEIDDILNYLSTNFSAKKD
jgi:quinoprotein glucose dehydrogenase